MKPYDSPRKKAVITTAALLAGNALLAFLVAAFIIPHDIIMGGTTGIGIVLNRVFPALDVSVFVLILNLILLLAGFVFLGKKFALTTVASSVLYPVFMYGMQRVPGIDSMTDDPLLAAIFAGCLMGIALGIVMRVGSSTGGMDVVNLILHKYLHLPVALMVYATDILVVGGQAIFSPAEKTLLGILVLVLESLLLDRTIVLGKAQTQLFVISKKYEEVRLALTEKLNAGVTMTLIETGRLGEKQKGVLCVIPQRKLYTATEEVRRLDPEAFMTITRIREVRGRGFTLKQQKMDRRDLP